MFDIKKDIQAMTTFRRNPAKFLKHLPAVAGAFNRAQHSITFKANPPNDVSLYRDCISIPV